jgi:hypothetical protein
LARYAVIIFSLDLVFQDARNPPLFLSEVRVRRKESLRWSKIERESERGRWIEREEE